MLIWSLLEFAIVVLLIITSGRLIPFIFSRYELNAKKPEDVPDELWEALQAGENKAHGEIIGILERTIAAIATFTSAYILVAGWLAFKVASKWQVWSNVISIPKSVEGVDAILFLRARRVYGSCMLMKFLIGTSTNIVLGFLIIFAAKLIF